MNAAWFWVAFWPNMASTAIGIDLGLPIALWLNRLAQRDTNRRLVAEERGRLTHGIEAVVASLAHNKARLAYMVSVFEQKKVPFDLSLDTAAWDAARDEVASLYHG